MPDDRHDLRAMLDALAEDTTIVFLCNPTTRRAS